MKNYYNDEKRSREFIEGYMYDTNKMGEPVIVIFTGSGEKIILRDNPVNNLKLQNYIKKMEEQAREGSHLIPGLIKKLEKKETKIEKAIYLIFILLVSVLLLGVVAFDATVLTNWYIPLIALNFGSIIVLDVVKTIIERKNDKKIMDIEKNACFLNFNDILLQSLSKSGKALEGLSSKTYAKIMDYYEADELNINACNDINFDEVLIIRDNLQKEIESKKVLSLDNFRVSNETDLSNVQDGPGKILAFTPKSSFGGKRK